MGIVYREGNTIGAARTSTASAANGMWQPLEVDYRLRNGIWPQKIVKSGLVLHLDAAIPESYSGSGTTWTDLSGNGNNGTLVNGVGYVGTNGGSLSFDGVNDYVNFSSEILTNAVTAISCLMWIYPNSDGVVLAILGQSTINTSYHHSAIEIGSSGQLRMSMWHGGLTNRINSTLSLNTWNNVGFTYAGTTFIGYLNGSSVGTTTFTWSKPSNIYFGIMSTESTNMGTSAYGDGNVSNIQVYNRALSASEIQQNFDALRNRYGI
jgi:hypothetical protein